MKRSIPLSAKLLLWLLLNFALLGALAAIMSGGVGWRMLLTQSVRDRLFSIGQEFETQLDAAGAGGTASVLSSLGTKYSAQFVCCEEIGGPRPPDLPPTASLEAARGGPPPMDRPMGPPPDAPPPLFDRPPPPPDGQKPPGAQGAPHDLVRQITIRRTDGRYEVRLPILIGTGSLRHPQTLLITPRSITKLLALLGLEHLLLATALAIAGSVVLWVPILADITRRIARVTAATLRVAEGRFDVRLKVSGRDEVGVLSASVNRMAERLQRSQNAQRYFLADLAHEVTAPLSRLQIALGILESRDHEDTRGLLIDLQDDAQQMYKLVREILLFSKADQDFAQNSASVRFSLAELIQEATTNEEVTTQTDVSLEDNLEVENHRALILRALSNILRNARRYGGEGRIEVLASCVGEEIRLEILDRGPGVNAVALPRLGEPFYRPELSRTRDSGGFGLGLAIVQRCIAACGGTVRFANRQDGLNGFHVTLFFPQRISLNIKLDAQL